jgi:hypothetical protein
MPFKEASPPESSLHKESREALKQFKPTQVAVRT